MINRVFPAVSRTVLILFMVALPAASWARSHSGGYSRSSATRSSSLAAPRTPSTSSSGYSRPAAAWSLGGHAAPASAADRTLTRHSAQDALTAFRAGNAAAAAEAMRRPSDAVAAAPVSVPRRPSTADYSHGHQRGFFDRIDLDDMVEAAVPLLVSRAAPAPTVVVVNAPSSNQVAPPPVSSPPALPPLPVASTAPVTATPLPSLPAVAGTGFGVFGWTLLALIVSGGVIFFLWRRTQRASHDPHHVKPSMFSSSAHQPDRPQWLRVGMTLPVDPSLFILAAPFTAVTAPEAATASGFLSVERLGSAASAGLTWYRLYVSDGQGFFQLHLDAAGQPDECRYFSQLDEVAPADAEEWSVWLDDHTGMIGWPDFATKNGWRYQRQWSPGQTRIAPRSITEKLEMSGAGVTQRLEQAMLYARATGAAAPAPVTEYLLVSAIEQDAAAWIALWVGIDIPIVALQLS